jgi:phosphatidylglycerophosphate synthase
LSEHSQAANPQGDGESKPELIIVADCDVRIWGLSAAERHRRAFKRAEVEEGSHDESQDVIIVRADYLFAEDLIKALVNTRGALLVVPAVGSSQASENSAHVAVAAHAPGDSAEDCLTIVRDSVDEEELVPPVGMRVLRIGELASSYDHHLRKRALPLALSLSDTPLAEVECKTFDAVYKGATDFVTKWCWPVPARWVTRWAAARGITPNTVTTASLLLVFLVTWLFAQGYFLVAIPAAWAMTFLDTVDGKLARVTLTSSPWGNVYDHGIDLIHPPFWWWAWYHGIQPVSGTQSGAVELAFWIILGGYLLGRALEGIFVRAFKIQTHVWRPIDSFFRTITARRNPNMAILTVATVAGAPVEGFIAVGVWTVISVVFHAVRLGQAWRVQRRQGEIRSWLSEPL